MSTKYHPDIKIDETLQLLSTACNYRVMNHLVRRLRGRHMEDAWREITKVALDHGAYDIAHSCTIVLFTQYNKSPKETDACH